MNANTKLHMKVFSSNFEMSLEAGIFIVLVDFMWVVHDIMTNGFSVFYAFIAIGLLMGTGWLSYILFRHHMHKISKLNKRKS